MSEITLGSHELFQAMWGVICEERKRILHDITSRKEMAFEHSRKLSREDEAERYHYLCGVIDTLERQRDGLEDLCNQMHRRLIQKFQFQAQEKGGNADETSNENQ